MNRAEELAKQAQERAEACRKTTPVRTLSGGTDECVIRGKTSDDMPGKGHGATPEQWPDGACGCGNWSRR